jgi:hypothetical protein
MRVVTWNCHMALHEKWTPVTEWSPDILIVQEAASPTVLRAKGVPLPSQVQWVGSDKNRGLLVAAFGKYRLRVAETYFPGLHWVLPLVVTGPDEFTLLAACDMYSMDRQGDAQAAASDAVTAALSRYGDLLAGGSVVLAGDLNNNVLFDRHEVPATSPRPSRPSTASATCPPITRTAPSGTGRRPNPLTSTFSGSTPPTTSTTASSPAPGRSSTSPLAGTSGGLHPGRCHAVTTRRWSSTSAPDSRPRGLRLGGASPEGGDEHPAGGPTGPAAHAVSSTSPVDEA